MKALFLTQIWPEKNASGASTRTLQLVGFLLGQGTEVHIWSDADENLHHESLGQLGCQTQRLPPNNSRFDSEIERLMPDLVIFDRFSIEEKFSFRVRQHCPSALRILDTVDLHSVRLARGAQLKAMDSQSLCCPEFDFACYFDQESGHWEREVAAIMRSDLVLVVSDFERDLLQGNFMVPQSHVLLCRLGYPTNAFETNEISNEISNEIFTGPDFESRTGFVALGSFLHPPNVDAFEYLLKNFWPRLREALPRATLNVWGSHMAPKHLELAARYPGVKAMGHAPCAIEVLAQARVHLALVRYGAGIKSKLSDAFFANTPSVTTPIGVEGMLETFAFPGFVSQTLDDALEKALVLHEEKAVWEQARTKCRDVLETHYNTKAIEKQFLSTIASILKNTAEHRRQNPLGKVFWHQTCRSTEYFSRWIETKNQRGCCCQG